MKKELFENEVVAEMLLALKNYVENDKYAEGLYYLQSFYETLKDDYPNNAKRTMISIHYANNFSDENLKSISFVLDEMNAFLSKHKCVKRDSVADYFNGMFNSKLEEPNFMSSPEYEKTMVLMDIDSLMYALIG